VCVFGPTGCGKSALLAGLLGDARCVAGSVRLHGKVGSCRGKKRLPHSP
jgi:ABC-type cobalamin/Fe3+-siderophores transport system ATPase subunit